VSPRNSFSYAWFQPGPVWFALAHGSFMIPSSASNHIAMAWVFPSNRLNAMSFLTPCSMLIPPPSFRPGNPLPRISFSRMNVSCEYPPQTPQMAFSTSRFDRMMFSNENVISIPCAGA